MNRRRHPESEVEIEPDDDFDHQPSWSLPKLPVISSDPSTEGQGRSSSDPELSIERAEAPPKSAPEPLPPSRRIRITRRDQALFRQLARTGVAGRNHILEGAQLTPHRLDTLIRHGYLSRRNFVVWGHNVAVYTLTLRGQRKLKQTGFGLIYRRNSRQTPHDLKLTSIYYKLPPNIRETWRHESELISELRARGIRERGYCVDAAVVIDGQSYGVEALSPHYKPHEIAAKQQFIQDFFDGRGIVI